MRVAQQALPEADQAFHIEKHGIDYISPSERWAKPHHLFSMWTGASFQIEYFVYGVILMAFFGLDFAEAVVVIVVGNLSYVLLGLTSLQGPTTGTTAMTITRAGYGPNGTRAIALFNWLTQVGFETEGLILIVYAAEVLMLKAGFVAGTPAKIVLILIAVVIQLLVPLLGHATMLKTLRALTVPFLVLFGILAGFTLGRVHLGAVTHGGDWRQILVGLAFTIALSGLGWTECGNDYSRYLPASTKKSSIVAWVVLGTAVPEILIMILGAAVGTYASSIATGVNPFAAFESPHVIPTGFLVPLLIVCLFQLFAINSLDMYSSGVTLQTLGLSVKRWQAVLIDMVIAGGVTVYAIFNASFHTLLGDFAEAVICWIAPWMAIFLVDWTMRRRHYDVAELQRTDRGGLYFRNGGFHYPAVLAQALGTFAAVEAISQSFFVGQISRWVGPDKSGTYPDFSIYIGIFVAGLVYFVLARRGVVKEVARQQLDDEPEMILDPAVTQ